jgi:hypothetical protein
MIEFSFSFFELFVSVRAFRGQTDSFRTRFETQPRMKKISWIIFSTALLGAAACAQSIRPETFAYQAKIDVGGAGPFHQFALPMSLYQSVRRSDLGDLRVFNGKGEVVPHALLRAESTTESQRREIALSVFPIKAAKANRDEAVEMSVEVRKNTDGTLVSIRQSATPGSASGKNTDTIRGVLLDASQIRSGLRSLHLSVGPTTTPFHFFSVETSDDLLRWRMLKSDAQFVRFEHDERRIEKDTVEWDGDAGRYLRILWSEPQQAPVISAVAAGIVQTAFNRAPMIWSDSIAASQTQNGAYDYALPGRMPLEQLRIGLPQANTLAPLLIQRYAEGGQRRNDPGRWDNLAQAVAYRLTSPQGEVRSPDIVLNSHPENRLRLVSDLKSGGVGATPPSLQVGFVPHILVFLARGEAPFTLAWSTAGVDNAALTPAMLVPGYLDGQKLDASPATLQAQPGNQTAAVISNAPKESSGTASKGLLWAVLIAGVLVLGGMAWMLVRQMKQAASTEK